MTNLLRHLFLPHHSNNHRARVLHIDALFLYAVALVFFQFAVSYIHEKYPNVLGYATDIHVEQLLADTNAKRQEAGLAPLQLNAELSQAAAAKASDMFAKGYWAHQSPDGKSPWDFIVGAGYHYTVAGENLAKNFNDSIGVVNAWMNSPSHRENILKPSYHDIGFAVVNGVLAGEETTLVVQMFGTQPGAIAGIPNQIVKQVEAKTPAETSPAPAAYPTVAPTAAPKPVVIPNLASTAPEQPQMPVLVAGFSDVFNKPIFDLSRVSRGIVYVFIGFMLGVFALDAWLVARHRIVRVTGHNLAHVVFLGTLLLSLTALVRGVVL